MMTVPGDDPLVDRLAELVYGQTFGSEYTMPAWSRVWPELQKIFRQRALTLLQTVADTNRLTPAADAPHTGVAPGRCSCGFDAYRIRGVMLDYHQLLLDHMYTERRKRQPW